MRPSWDEVWMDVAAVVARRATCPRARVGAVVVSRNNTLVSTGYNGAPRGQPHCVDVGCELGVDGSCRRVVHAELNALIQAGANAVGGTLYVTVEPCPSCAAAVANSGLVRVVFAEPYHAVDGVRPGREVLASAGVCIERIGGRG